MGIPSEALVGWSRAQFALTALYHWLFVPLTLGLTWIVAIMHTIYAKTGSEEWKKITKFWMKLLGINFAIGVATGIILEFEFGTNWSNYSWFVGDIFGAPLAIEGILAFFMEATFVAVMFFGWDRVSKGFHVASSWLTALGTNLSAIWILIANAWMQHPTGMHFNPDTARNEMVSFAAVALNPTAITKFLHTISQAYLLAGFFVMGISAWYLLRGREIRFAKKSMIVGSTFAMLAGLWLLFTADIHARDVFRTQPLKFAAMEGVYKGQPGAPSVVFGIVNPKKKPGDDQPDYIVAWRIPKLLSILATEKANGYVPGIDDLLYGDTVYTQKFKEGGYIPVKQKITWGKIALQALKEYKLAKKNNDEATAQAALQAFEKYSKYLGYGYFDKPEQIVPPVTTVAYTFHLMVLFGFYFITLAIIMWILAIADKLENKNKFWLWLTFISLFLTFLTSELGWTTAEAGRQPWAVTGLLPVKIATSHLSVADVKVTFFMFLVIFTVLLIAEIGIMVNVIKKGPKIEEN